MANTNAELLMYVLLFVFGTILMHMVSKYRLGSRSGVAYFRRFLSEKERRKLSDAQLRGRLVALHSSPVAWLLDALAMLGVLCAVLIATRIVGNEAGFTASLKYLMAFALIALPIMFLVSVIRAKFYRAKLHEIAGVK